MNMMSQEASRFQSPGCRFSRAVHQRVDVCELFPPILQLGRETQSCRHLYQSRRRDEIALASSVHRMGRRRVRQGRTHPCRRAAEDLLHAIFYSNCSSSREQLKHRQYKSSIVQIEITIPSLTGRYAQHGRAHQPSTCPSFPCPNECELEPSVSPWSAAEDDGQRPAGGSGTPSETISGRGCLIGVIGTGAKPVGVSPRRPRDINATRLRARPHASQRRPCPHDARRPRRPSPSLHAQQSLSSPAAPSTSAMPSGASATAASTSSSRACAAQRGQWKNCGLFGKRGT